MAEKSGSELHVSISLRKSFIKIHKPSLSKLDSNWLFLIICINEGKAKVVMKLKISFVELYDKNYVTNDVHYAIYL